MAFLVAALPASAQIYKSAGSQSWTQDSSGIEGGAETDDFFGQAVAIGDFDRDGYADLAIGAPEEDDGEGAVHFIFGGPANPPSSFGGVTAAGDMLFQQDEILADIVPPGVLGSGGGGFGFALAVGDFDGNGTDDLAIGVPYASSGSDISHGEVNVLYSNSTVGPGWYNQLISQDIVSRSSGGFGDGDITGAEETGDGFGWSLAAGDFNNDGFDDLAIGAPFEDSSGYTDNGAISIIYGSTLGLHWTQEVDDQFWDLDSDGIKGVADDDAHYGWSLVAGDFDGDNYDDLAIGIPEFDVDGKSEAGAVSVMYGSSTGITDRDQLWHLDVVLVDGVKGVADGSNVGDFGDGFGFSLAAGDFDNDGYDDLAIGSPEYEASFCGLECPDGAVNVLFGTSSELTDAGDLQFFGDNTNSSLERFSLGVALAAGDFNDDGYDDLVAGAPDDAFSGTYDWKGGRVAVYLSNGNVLVEAATLNPQSLSGGSSSDDGAAFGYALAFGDLNGDGAEDFVAGAPRRNSDKGLVHVIYGDRDRDRDGDSELYSPIDNCPTVYNPTQTDWDNDGRGDACDLLTSVTVSGPSFCQGYETIQLTATATWSDGDVRNVTSSATWSVNSTQNSSISSSGALYCNVVFSVTGTTARASYSQGGTTREGTHNVSIQPRPISYEVVGPNAVDEGTNTQYRVDGTLLNGSVVNWSSHVTWSENRDFTTISSAGVLSAGAVTTDQVVRISAQDPHVQDPFILDVTVRDVPTVTSLVISGPLQVPESTSAQYTATAHWSNGSTSDVTSAATWGENSDASTISSSGLLSAGAVDADTAIQITANYVDPTRGGAPGVNDTFDVTIQDVPTLTSLVVSGPLEVPESSSAQYTATAHWSNGSTTNVTAEAYWSENSEFSTISPTGMLSTSEVDAATQIQVSAIYSGTARLLTPVGESDTLDVTILDVPPTLTALEISGSSFLNEGADAQYTATATWSDGATTDVTASAQWEENSPYISVSGTGLVSALPVDAQQVVTLYASFSHTARGTTTVADTFEITVLDVPPELVGLVVSGPSTVVESSEVQFTATALWSDGSTTDVTAQANWQEDTEFSSFSAPGTLLVDEVPAGLEITVTASYDNNIVFVDDSMTATALEVENVLIFEDGFEDGDTLQWAPARR